MTEEEQEILEHLNGMLTRMNTRIKTGTVSPEEYKKLRATASSIYVFADQHQHLRPRDRSKISTFPLIEDFKLQPDSAVKAAGLKQKIKSYLVNNPIAKGILSAVRKIRHIISPGRKKTRLPKKSSATASLMTSMTPGPENPFDKLPSEITQYILAMPPAKDRSIAGGVSRSMYAMANDDQLWKADIQRTYDLTTKDIDLIKEPNESYKQLFVRLRNNMDTFLLFRSVDKKALDFFNADLKELSRGQAFETFEKAQQASTEGAMQRRPVILECHLPIALVKKKMDQGDAPSIAPHIRRIDSRDVIFVGTQFQLKTPTLTKK